MSKDFAQIADEVTSGIGLLRQGPGDFVGIRNQPIDLAA